MLARLLALVAPPACLHCHEPPAHAAALLCPACAGDLPWLGPTCPRCALPRCSPCPARRAAFSAAWAPWALAGPARALVHALKFRGALQAADALAAPMAAMAPDWVPRGAGAPSGRAQATARDAVATARDAAATTRHATAATRDAAAATRGDLADPPPTALVPVPADPLRARRRGLDHAALLAGALGARLDLPVQQCLRRRPGGRQVGAGRAARRSSVAAAVTVRRPPPALAVLVDDVHTTGATLDACARALLAAGAGQVLAVTAARAL